jgi:hypothetical protein
MSEVGASASSGSVGRPALLLVRDQWCRVCGGAFAPGEPIEHIGSVAQHDNLKHCIEHLTGHVRDLANFLDRLSKLTP